MKQLLLFCFLITFSVNSQDFSLVDEKVKSYPKLISAKKLAQNIKNDFNSDITKVRAVFSWLAQNIRYDLQELYNPTSKSIRFSYSSEKEKLKKLKAIKNGIVSNTLNKRKAVCEGYAQTFSKTCDLLGIENEVIKGYVRNSSEEIGKPELHSNHAWNAVKIDNRWLYFDATWAAGYLMNGKWLRNFNDYYFNFPKEKYFLTHYPEDKLWQLRVGRITKNQFYNQPIYSHSFLKSNAQLIKPISGIIRIKNGESIKLQFQDLSSKNQVYYNYAYERYSKKATFDDNILSLFPPKKSTDLYLFFNRNLALQFKILIK